jgi:hypothetical protein
MQLPSPLEVKSDVPIQCFSLDANFSFRLNARLYLVLLSLLLPIGLSGAPAMAQGNSSTEGQACTLEKHVYTCDGTAFQKRLAEAKTISLETHSIDKYAQAQLKTLITKKLGKTLVAEGSPADLVFLLLPVGVDGMSINSGSVDLGTLRIYTANPDNTRGNILWAEVYTGHEDLPWPATVNGLILQFQTHFKIK